MLLPHLLLYGQHFKWGPRAVLTFGVMGSRRVISPPLIATSLCPLQKVNKPF